ncbi:MAG: ATP-binding protein [Oscillospiraceae bacterium]|nr:ATP-binding protein [Oscillospiraceae bacterium]
MTSRIFKAICTVTLAVLLASLVLVMGVLYDYFSNSQLGQLRSLTSVVSRGVADEGAAFLSELESDRYRVTWIAADGSVLYDSQSDPAQMGNHLDREEVREALETGFGESARYSTTLTEKLLYFAERLPDGTVLRLSGAQYTTLTLTLAIVQPVLVIIAVAVVIALLLASRLSKKIVEPLNSIDLDEPLSSRAYPELSPLLERLDSQQRQLRQHAAELRRRKEELETITDNMSEGFVLLNEKGKILSINRRAAQTLGVSGDSAETIYTCAVGAGVRELADSARGGLATERTLDIANRRYRFNTSPIMTDAAPSGIAMLIFDVTESEQAEQMRREFTANVSHELKTPLHSISGCAELLKDGMVRSEDIRRFSEQIYSEAQRMIRLVDDIIRLSCLDEGGKGMTREQTDLHALAEAVVESLRPTAEAAEVSLSLEGGSACLDGIPQLLSGIIYNLCDNAIKYNRMGGSVSVRVDGRAEEIVLSVSDTGIGIAPEHRQRIFERFYRVDKSHSKEVGGTGLGLSIVKHAALLHGAEIELESAVGAGTVVRVRFPKN